METVSLNAMPTINNWERSASPPTPHEQREPLPTLRGFGHALGTLKEDTIGRRVAGLYGFAHTVAPKAYSAVEALRARNPYSVACILEYSKCRHCLNRLGNGKRYKNHVGWFSEKAEKRPLPQREPG